MKDITVIIPFPEPTEENYKLLERAIGSVPSDYSIYLSVPSNIELNDINFPNTESKVLKETEKTTFQDLVNAAAKKVETRWFSILEFDDEYTDIWFKEVEREIEYKPEVSVFLPLEDVIEYESGKYLGFGNEAPLASAFSNELGYIDLDCLQNFFDFYLTGSIFSTKDFLTLGGLKPSIQITFWYEWLLRATNKGKLVYVVPKVGYTHYLGRPNSLVTSAREKMSEKESQWWFDVAKKEYFYTEERSADHYVYKEEESEEE